MISLLKANMAGAASDEIPKTKTMSSPSKSRSYRRPFDPEEFLETVRKFPFLYDKNEAHFKDTRFKEKHWHRIGAVYGMTGEACCNKFKNMKDRYTKIVTAIEKAANGGDSTKEVKYIRWKVFPLLHEILSSTPFCKTLPVDIKSLLSNSTTSPFHDNDDSSNKDDLVLGCETNDDEEEEEQDSNTIVSDKHIIIHANPSQLFQDDDIVIEEHEDMDGPPRILISGTNSSDEKFTFTGETSTASAAANSTKYSQQRKRMRLGGGGGQDNISQALSWATQIIEAVESKRQGQQQPAKIDCEEEEVAHFTSLIKHRLLKLERKRRLTIMHNIENMLYDEEMDTQ